MPSVTMIGTPFISVVGGLAETVAMSLALPDLVVGLDGGGAGLLEVTARAFRGEAIAVFDAGRE
jgi:hypothetical protein